MLGKLNCYLIKVGVFLITAALIILMVGCPPVPPPSQDLEIRDWYDLDAVRDNLAGHHILMNDLDSTTSGYTELASSTANQGKGWQPIGIVSQGGGMEFTGTLEGQGHDICDLFINRPDRDNVGLFGVVGQDGVIKDISVVNVTVTGNSVVGGLVGIDDGTVSNSYSSGNVTGGTAIGGLVGINDGTVSNSYATGTVTGEGAVGGLVGYNDDGTVSNSYSSGSVTGGDAVGGLAGGNACTVSNSYSTGSVTGEDGVGGLVGWNGGIISNSYSTGSVSGNEDVGGLLGFNYDSTVISSFWDVQTSGQATSAGGTGKNTTEMQNIDTFSGAGWNIITVALNETNPAYIWNIVNNVTYPFLSWQP
jgi:hypothetical protein